MFNVLTECTKNFKDVHYITVLFAISLQIQITLFAEGDYLGLRVGLADIFLPFVGIYVLQSLFTRRYSWPAWSVKNMYFWLAALICVMSVALLNGYLVNGFLSGWALVNKYIGLFFLISYFLLGGWIITNSQDAKYTLRVFTATFSSFFILTVSFSALIVFLDTLFPYSLWLADYPWDGFMANRNAYMVIFVMTSCFVIWSYRDIAVPKSMKCLFWIILPIFYIFNDSRTAWLVSVPLFIIFLSAAPVKKLKTIVPLVFLGMLLLYSSYQFTTSYVVLDGMQAKYLWQVVEGNTNYKGDLKRFIAVEDGLELYGAYDPMIGAGLGSYKPFQIMKRGEFIEVIDFTALWLLTETGILGVTTFAAFFLVCMFALYKAGFRNDDSGYHRAMLTFLIMFAFMCIFHELMYTRVLWFSVGLALISVRLGESKA